MSKLAGAAFVKRNISVTLDRLLWVWKARGIVVSPWNAFKFFDSTAGPDVIGNFRYRNGRFVCRKQDWFGIKEIFIDHEYRPVISCLSDSSTPVVVDLGANIGGFALFIFGYFPDASVLSVEPAPDTFQLLMENRQISINQRWNVVQAALWKENGFVRLDRREASTGHRVAEESVDGELVPARRLDELLAELDINAIDLLKIDIEGAEENVIPGISTVLKNTRILIIEVHTDRIDPRPIYEVLSQIFRNCWRLKKRSAQKPVFIFSNERLAIDDVEPIALEKLLTGFSYSATGDTISCACS